MDPETPHRKEVTMTLVLCLDDNLGMMFNHRRQSRDRVLIEELLETVGDSRLFVSPYSKALFPEGAGSITVAEDPGIAAGEEDFAFVEDTDPAAAWEKVNSLIIYRWNRAYPADTRFTCDLTGFRMTEVTAFEGSSHELINKEIWKK
jgi:hypothetical protein